MLSFPKHFHFTGKPNNSFLNMLENLFENLLEIQLENIAK